MSRRTLCINPTITRAHHVPIGLRSPLKPNFTLVQR